jgi:hypothetical protein
MNNHQTPSGQPAGGVEPLDMDEALSRLITANELIRLAAREVLAATEGLTGARHSRASELVEQLTDAYSFGLMLETAVLDISAATRRAR